jgi:hypothetical protein
MKTDSIIVSAVATDTIYSSLFDVYPGDELKAHSWMELSFYETSLYKSNLNNMTYHRCVNCSEFVHILNNYFPTQGRYTLMEDDLLIEKWNERDYEYEQEAVYFIEFLENDRIRVTNWCRFPVVVDPDIIITHINGFEVEPGDYLFDVIFKPK